MNIQGYKHYGKDILTISKETQMSIGTRLKVFWAALQYLISIIFVLGPVGLVKLIRGIREETEAAESLDWTRMRERGLSETDRLEILKKMAMAKVMVKLMGIEKAAA